MFSTFGVFRNGFFWKDWDVWDSRTEVCNTMYITLGQRFCSLANRSAGGSLLIPSWQSRDIFDCRNNDPTCSKYAKAAEQMRIFKINGDFYSKETEILINENFNHKAIIIIGNVLMKKIRKCKIWFS